jgi:TraY domain
MSSVIGESKRTSEVQTVPVTVLLAPSMREQLVKLAQRNDRSVGGEVRLALRAHLSDDETEGAA